MSHAFRRVAHETPAGLIRTGAPNAFARGHASIALGHLRFVICAFVTARLATLRPLRDSARSGTPDTFLRPFAHRRPQSLPGDGAVCLTTASRARRDSRCKLEDQHYLILRSARHGTTLPFLSTIVRLILVFVARLGARYAAPCRPGCHESRRRRSARSTTAPLPHRTSSSSWRRPTDSILWTLAAVLSRSRPASDRHGVASCFRATRPVERPSRCIPTQHASSPRSHRTRHVRGIVARNLTGLRAGGA